LFQHSGSCMQASLCTASRTDSRICRQLRMGDVACRNHFKPSQSCAASTNVSLCCTMQRFGTHRTTCVSTLCTTRKHARKLFTCVVTRQASPHRCAAASPAALFTQLQLAPGRAGIVTWQTGTPANSRWMMCSAPVFSLRVTGVHRT
jgi:hypothetical protein